MRIGLITTIDTNIGDDLIRKGIQRLLRAAYGDDLEFVFLNKHRPLDVFALPSVESALRRLPRGATKARNLVSRLVHPLRASIFDQCDMIVQCGAPVFFPQCHRAEWAMPVWDLVIGDLYKKIPVFNLAAGSCYPWEAQPSAFPGERDRAFARMILERSRLTTCRDDLAQALCAELGFDLPAIECTAFLAARGTIVAAPQEQRKLILVNYMQGGGHFSWGQKIDPSDWETTFRQLIGKLSKLGDVAFLAHDKKELAIHKKLFPEGRHILPVSVDQYFELSGQVRLGVFNRLHAAVGWAGAGVPTIAIGTDTRMKMAEKIGIPTYYVRDCSAEQLESVAVDLWNNADREFERYRQLSDRAFGEYGSLIAGHA
jgi:hypothetical protein